MPTPYTFTIRREEPGDAEALYQIFSGPRVCWGTMQVPYPSAEFWRKRLAEPPEGLYALVACAEGEVVGHLGLHTNPKKPRLRHAANLGMAVRDDWQGKGAGTALMRAAVDLADNWLNLVRLGLSVFVDNEPAIRLYKKFGFVIESTQVKAVFRDGQYVDTYGMARIRPGLWSHR